MGKQDESDALAAVHETALGLRDAGVIHKQTMKAFDAMCLRAAEDSASEPREIGRT